MVAFRLLATSFMPLQLIAYVEGKVVVVFHVHLGNLVTPVNHMRSTELLKVEMYARGEDVPAVQAGP